MEASPLLELDILETRLEIIILNGNPTADTNDSPNNPLC